MRVSVGFLALSLSFVSVLLPRTVSATQSPVEDTRPPVSSDEQRRINVRELYEQGATLYETADYDGAIESFTEALKLVNEGGEDARVRGALLFNIAKAHMKAYDVLQDSRRLRKALAVYKRMVEDAEEGAGYPEHDVEDARAEIQSLEAEVTRLDAERLEASDGNAVEPQGSVQADRGRPVSLDSKSEPSLGGGVAAIAGGGIGIGGGVALIVYGRGYRPAAENQLRASAESDSFDLSTLSEGERRFLEDETRKGNVVIGVGIGVAVAGAVATVFGVRALSRRKRTSAVSLRHASPVVGVGTVGFSLAGDF